MFPPPGYDEQRNWVQRPAALGPGSVLADAVEHAGFAQIAVRRGETARQPLASERREPGQQFTPMPAYLPVMADHLVMDARQGPVIRQHLRDGFRGGGGG